MIKLASLGRKGAGGTHGGRGATPGAPFSFEAGDAGDHDAPRLKETRQVE
jgi:hypothetical protein